MCFGFVGEDSILPLKLDAFLFGRLIAYPYNVVISFGGSKPAPVASVALLPRFGYALSVAHGASSPRVRAFHRVVGSTRRALRLLCVN